MSESPTSHQSAALHDGTRDAAHLGVMGVHCPRGLTHEHWEGGLKAYARLKAQDTSFMGRMFTLRDLREAD